MCEYAFSRRRGGEKMDTATRRLGELREDIMKQGYR